MKNLVLIVLSLFCVEQGFSQIQYSSNNTAPQSFIENLSGPRVGFTIMTSGSLTENLEDELNLSSNFITQFGYQFEKQITGNEQVAGLVEGIVFIGGLEHGKFLPSVSGMVGARFATGYEFAIGPNLSLAGPALVIGFGKTIEAGNLNIPINFAWVPSVKRTETDYHYEYDQETGMSNEWETTTTESTGHRFTVTIGFNFRNR